MPLNPDIRPSKPGTPHYRRILKGEDGRFLTETKTEVDEKTKEVRIKTVFVSEEVPHRSTLSLDTVGTMRR